MATAPDPDAPSVTTAERVAAVLRDRIVAGELPSGTPLRETALAVELAVSRNTLREGLRLLTAQGLVSQQLYRGAVVETITTARLRSIYTARRALELHAVDESARAGDDRFAALATAATAAEQAVARRQWQEVGTASLRFHQAVVGLLGSDVLDEFFAQVVAQLRLAFGGARDEAGFQAPWVARDRELADLLLAGRRAEAREALRRYLEDSEESVLDVVRLAELRPAAPRRPGRRPAPVAVPGGDT
ncbi:GntR family transcriptional regulator [Blastococcus sp. SYSU D00820]